MKRKSRKRQKTSRSKLIIIICLSIVGIHLASVVAPQFENITGNLALVAAGVTLPEGGLELLTTNPGFKTAGSTQEGAANQNASRDESSANSDQSQQSSTVENPNTQSTIPAAEVPKERQGKIAQENLGHSGMNYKNVWINNSTGRTINIADELEKRPNITIKNTKEPQVLIVHTHATEGYELTDRGYYDKEGSTRTTNTTQSVVAVGKTMADRLEAQGIGVVHSTVMHDGEAYTGAYKRSAATIQEAIKKYPSIQVVIDLHRDSITRTDGTKIKPIAEVNNKKAAQVMIIAGCETKGGVPHPQWELNLRFAVRLQNQLETSYPGLARPLKFMNAVYNQSITNGSLLIEVGTDANTLDEAKYSGELLADALVKELSKLKG